MILGVLQVNRQYYPPKNLIPLLLLKQAVTLT